MKVINMSKHPISVYLEADTIKKVKARTESLGISQSIWISKLIERTLGNPMEAMEEIILEQLIKSRATLEQLIEQMPEKQRQTARAKISERVAKFMSAARKRLLE